MKGWLLVAAALSLTALSGCLDPSEDRVDPYAVQGCEPGTRDEQNITLVETTADVIPKPDGDAWDFERTNLRTCTLPDIARHPLRFDSRGDPDPHRYIGEMDMRGDLDLGAVAVLGNGETPGIYLLDITERDQPLVWSRIDQFRTYVTDVKFSDDGRFLFAASQSLPTSTGELTGIATGLPDSIPEGPSGSATPATLNGFTIYNVEDPAEPELVNTIPSFDDVGCHMLDYAFIDDTHVVFCVGQYVNVFGLQEVSGQLVQIGSLPYIPTRPDGAPCLNDMALVGDPSAGELCSGPHDMTVTFDPLDDRRYMTVSHWDLGVRVVDVTAPIDEGMVEVGSWNGEGAQHYEGNVHTATLFYVGEERYIMATPECTGPCTPALWVLDADDLSDLRLVGEWTHPAGVETPGLLLTLHQWQLAPTGVDADLEDVKVYITWNHAGVWVLSLEEILAGDDAGAILGFHMSREPLDPAENVGNAVLSTWDVNLVDGYIYGSDRATGLWVFHYVHDRLGDPALNGFL